MKYDEQDENKETRNMKLNISDYNSMKCNGPKPKASSEILLLNVEYS